jgi:hypothetical protein
MLPEEITTQKIRSISDLNDNEDIQNAIDDVMEAHINSVVETLTELYDLDPDQQEELTERIAWRLELLPLPAGPTNSELAS